MDADQLRAEVWYGLLDAERLARYYDAVAARLQHWHLAMTAFVATGSTGAVASLLFDTGLPDWVAGLLVLAVAAVTVWMSYYGYASLAATAESAARSLSALSLEWREVWLRVEDMDEAEVAGRISELASRSNQATAHVPARLAGHRRLNERCASETYQVVGNQYGA